MPVFPSEEWVAEFVNRVNENENYEDSARSWEGDFTFVIQKDRDFDETAYIHLDLFHGKCRSGDFQMSGEAPKSEFQYIGPYGNWVKLINREIDPIQGVLVGKFKLKGSMMKIMRYTRAAKELVNTANQVDTKFG